jgi:hypothetical protein
MAIEREKAYSTSGISDAELDKELDKLWNELWAQGSTLEEDAEAAHVDLSRLRGLKRKDAIETKREGEGIDPLTTALIVIFAKALAPEVAKVAHDLWEKVLLPRILRERGAKTLVRKNK